MVFLEKKKDGQTTPEDQQSFSPIPSPNEKDLNEIRDAVEPQGIFPTMPTLQVPANQPAPKKPVAAPRPEYRPEKKRDWTPEPRPQTVVSKTILPKSEPEEERPAPTFAPLFVKLDRYRNILNALGQLRASMAMIRNSFSALAELEHVRTETLQILQKAMDSVGQKVENLDKELVKPTGYLEPMHANEYADAATLEGTISELRGQVEQLKSELQQIV